MNYSERGKINIYCIIKDVLKDLWVALVVGISVSLLLYVGTRVTYEPQYTSRTTFVVSAKSSTTGPYGNITKMNRLTEIFQAVMDSNVLKRLVCEDLDINHFDGTVSISRVPETNLLTVSVTSNSPDMALKLLQSMLKCYPTVGEDVLGEVVFEVFEAPAYSTAPNNMINDSSVRKKGFVIGTAAMLAILILLSYFKDTVKNVEDVDKQLDTLLLAVLSHQKKYRTLKEFITKPKKNILINDGTAGFGYSETIKKVRTKAIYKMNKNGKNIIFVTSTQKNEGKSTFAINLADAMAQRFEKVLLIEGDLKKTTLIKMLGIEEGSIKGFGETLAAQGDLKEAICQPPKRKIQVLANTSVTSNPTELLASKHMDKFLRQISKEVDVIIIDGPPAKQRSDAEVLARISDISLLVVRQNGAEARYINDTIDMLEGYGEGLLGCVFNDVQTVEEIITNGYGYGSGYGYGYGKAYGYGKYRHNRYGGYGKYGKYGNYYHRGGE